MNAAPPETKLVTAAETKIKSKTTMVRRSITHKPQTSYFEHFKAMGSIVNNSDGAFVYRSLASFEIWQGICLQNQRRFWSNEISPR